MNNEQIMFYKELRKIQDSAIEIALCKERKYKKTEDILEDITYDVIYMICEMMDGYRNDWIKYKMVNIKNNNVVNENISLHDWCEEYLRCTDI